MSAKVIHLCQRRDLNEPLPVKYLPSTKYVIIITDSDYSCT